MQSVLVASCSLNSQWSFLLSQMCGPLQIGFTGHWFVFGWFFQCLRLLGTCVCVLLPTLSPAMFLVEYSLVPMQTFSHFQSVCLSDFRIQSGNSCPVFYESTVHQRSWVGKLFCLDTRSHYLLLTTVSLPMSHYYCYSLALSPLFTLTIINGSDLPHHQP